MKTLIKIILTFFCFNLYAIETKITNVSGETDYSKSSSSSLTTKLYIEYHVKLYEPSHKKWGLFLSGKVNPSYDHFGKEIRTDVFTVLGVDF
jgi:hypothetical protein